MSNNCPYCGKLFGDTNAIYRHAKAKHPKCKTAHLRPTRKDDDESFADRAIAASIAYACGEETDDFWLIEGSVG